jgi:hypothetical protein
MQEEDPVDPAEESGGGLFSEDWLATVVGIGILLLALAGLIPKEWLW